MTQIKYKTLGTGSLSDPTRCNLPTFLFISDLGGGVWTVEVPNEYLTNGLLDNLKIKQLYQYSNTELQNLQLKLSASDYQKLLDIQNADFASNQVHP